MNLIGVLDEDEFVQNNKKFFYLYSNKYLNSSLDNK